MDGTELYQKINQELNTDRMVDSVRTIGSWHRYTGTPQGEAFVDYLTGELDKSGIPYTVEKYPMYTSLPLSAELALPGEAPIRLIGDVFSADADGLEGELIYDGWPAGISDKENETRFATFRGKIVLSHSSGGGFAERVSRAGGKGIIHISQSPGGYIHHSNISAEWGTPCDTEHCFLGCIPSAGISLEDGEGLIRRLEHGRIIGRLSVKMDTRVRMSRMPVVHIPGETENFVLLNGHYDSWYEGITDNAGSDAILLELTRAFWHNRAHLKRGLRIAWWSGHSDARYAGSAWYCDWHWEELNRCCVANINLDLTGCKLAKQIRARTSCMEGESLTAGLIREFTGAQAKPYIPMIRGGDQSFWGVRIPINIMFKYEPMDEDRVSPCPSGGPWWHTDQDTMDKLDRDILLRDARINGKLACLIMNAPVLPVQMGQFLNKMNSFLSEIQSKLSEDFDLSGVIRRVQELAPLCVRLEKMLKRMDMTESDRMLKQTAGEIARLVYTSGSPYQHDRSEPYRPFGILAKAKGKTWENTPEALYVFELAQFRRACNRLEGQLEELRQRISR